MINREFRAIVLDLFDTLVRWEPERLPLMEINGRPMRTTMPWIFPRLQQHLGSAFDQGGFIDIYTRVLEEIALERERDGIEITCWERFVRTLKEWLADKSWDSDQQLAQLLAQFLAEYNDRPHQGLPLPGLSPNEFANRIGLL